MTMGEIVTTPKKKVTPPPEVELTEENYKEKLQQFLLNKMKDPENPLSQAGALAYATSAGQIFKEKGLSPDLPFINEIQNPRATAETLNRFRGQTQEWESFNQNYQKILDIAKQPGANYDQVKGALLNEVNRLGTTVNVDPLALSNLQYKAINDAFSSATPETQARLRETVEVAESFRRGKIDVWGQPVKTEGAPEYSRVFQEQASGMQGSQPYKDWFSSRYPSLMAGFTQTGGTKVQKEQAWTSYLSSASQRLQEEYSRISPYQRGQRPSAYAPPLKKIGF